MPRSSTSYQKGQTGNPKGRPPKKRALTTLLEKGGSRKFKSGDEEIAAKKLFVERVWQGLATGHLTFNASDGSPMTFPLDAQQYIALARLVLGQVDGPPKAEVDVTSEGKAIKSSTTVDDMKGLMQLMAEREKDDHDDD